MRYVLDSSMAFKWLVAEPGTPEALRLRGEFLAGRTELLAPDVLPVEVAHALTRAERQGRVSAALGSGLLKSLLQILPPLHPYLSLLPRAYDLSSALRVGVYDCLYLALAGRE